MPYLLYMYYLLTPYMYHTLPYYLPYTTLELQVLRPPASLEEEPDALRRHAIVKQLNLLVVARWAEALQVCIDKVADEAKKRKLTAKNQKRVKKPKLAATAVEVWLPLRLRSSIVSIV